MKKMKPIKGWIVIQQNGLLWGDMGGGPYIYLTKKRAQANLPKGWRIARVVIREAQP